MGVTETTEATEARSIVTVAPAAQRRLASLMSAACTGAALLCTPQYGQVSTVAP